MSKSKSKKKDQNQDINTKKNILTITALLLITIVAVGIGLYFRNNPISNSLDDEQIALDVIEKLRENPNSFNKEGFNNLNSPTTFDQTNYVITEGGHFISGIELLRIGNEVITSDDFNVYLFTFNQETYLNDIELTDQLLHEAFDQISRESVLLQEFLERYDIGQHLLFTEPERDASNYRERAEAGNYIVETFDSEHVNSIKGETLSIWFYNILEPAVGADTAQNYSLTVMEDLRKRIDSAEITMSEAADEILDDKELVSYDFSIEQNVYNVFNSEDGYDVFIDSNMNEILPTLQAGELSEIILGEDTKNGTEYYPAFYSIILVNEITGDGVTLDEVYEESVFKDDMEVL